MKEIFTLSNWFSLAVSKHAAVARQIPIFSLPLASHSILIKILIKWTEQNFMQNESRNPFKVESRSGFKHKFHFLLHQNHFLFLYFFHFVVFSSRSHCEFENLYKFRSQFLIPIYSALSTFQFALKINPN